MEENNPQNGAENSSPKRTENSPENAPAFTEKVLPKVIEEEMKEAYVNYAMSVIIGRALPDVRDGLKPVHRRILYAMQDMGMFHNKPFKKCARIVGEVLGKYHPHGDIAVYDALVRMAQDFSLRYPLIKGQGNFGCFTAETQVKLVDSRDLTFLELIEEHQQGKRNFTFTIDDGLVTIAEIKNPRLTRKNAEIMTVILDNGEEIRCTLNHKFMLKNKDYKEAKDLLPGDSLMPAYQKFSTKEENPNAVGYEMILQPKDASWDFVHVLADEWNIKQGVYPKSAGRIRHHLDFNKLNNCPLNLKRMHWKEHWQTHYNLASEKHKNDESYRKKLAEGRKAFWSNKENREAYAKRLSERNINNWKNGRYRKRMIKNLSEVNKEYLAEHPEVIEQIRTRASNTMKRMWQIPEYRQLFHKTIIAANKKRVTNLTGKKKFLKICRYLSENNLPLERESYEEARTKIFGSKSFTRWSIGLEKYYHNNKDLILAETNKNHKIKAIKFTGEFADVYDLTIERTHNFALAAGVFVHNSIDGDNAAAMRYTESKLNQLAEEMLRDLEKNTINFKDNFDASLKEPEVLPNKFPNLLANGSTGIAVGMATSIPPHNLREVCEATIETINNPEIGVEELMQILPGPDFPTGGEVICGAALWHAYAKGKGKVTIKAVIEMEEDKIIVKEIPYMVNKSELIEQIADLVRDKKILGIRNLNDESDREGIRIVIELKKDTDPQVVLNQLYQYSRMKTSFGINLLALVQDQPKVLGLKELIQHHILHRKEVINRRTKYDLEQAEARVHVLIGLLIALEHIDEVIPGIKNSATVEEARDFLMRTFSLTEIQAKAILDLKLQKLASLEQEKIRTEHKELLEKIKLYQEILASERKVLELIKEELTEIKDKYGDNRKSKIVPGEDGEDDFDLEELIEETTAVVTITNSGYVKRLPVETYKTQKRGGKGIKATGMKEEDFVEKFYITSTHDHLLFFTDQGQLYWLKVYHVPEGSRQSRGKHIANLIELSPEEKITAVIPVRDFKEGYLFMATRNGTVKRTELLYFSRPRKGGIKAIELDEKDTLVGVKHTTGSQEIILATLEGMANRFQEKDVRAVGRAARGVRGIKLDGEDKVIGMLAAEENKEILTLTEKGYGKRTLISDYRLCNRGGKGVTNIKITDKNGPVKAVMLVDGSEELMVMSKNGIAIRTKVSDVSVIGRATQGVRIMRLEENDSLAAAAKIITENGEINGETNGEKDINGDKDTNGNEEA